jgi:hypothetical protein
MFPIIRHASSHGFSVLICTIASALIIELLKPLLPNFMASLGKVSTRIVNAINLPMSVENMNILLLATILAVIWGIFFKLRLNRRDN